MESLIRDPQVLAFIEATNAAYPDESNQADPTENRRAYDVMCARFHRGRPEGLSVQDRRIGGVACRIYGASSERIVLYLHGGGFVVGGLESHDDICAEIADATGLQVVSVDYRLAPEHRHPAQIEDVRAVWQALDLPGVVVGDSAGGCLAAALCLTQRGEGRMPLGQVLIYPGLGGDGGAASYVEMADAPMLRSADIATYHQLWLGGQPPDELAAPLSAADLSGLPPAYIVTANVDPLRDDGRDYAERLRAAGIPALWRNEPELPHGYLRARASSDRARRSFQAVISAIARISG